LIRITHEGNKVLNSENLLPRFPVDLVENVEGKSSCQRTGKHSRCQRNEAGQLVAEFGAVAEGQGEEADPVTLAVPYKGDLIIPCRQTDPVHKGGKVIHGQFANSPV